MIVCVCEGVSDREIRSAIQRGSDTLEALGQACRAGVDCGRCRQSLRGLLTERCRTRSSERVSPRTQTEPLSA